ncbi:NlpC/P60 family protein [Priestia filamentosa]|uniref:C40 family peptidase n=1 Tax=Priestia filamentosa TaxID=1402861 RepID=UPI00397DE013
MKNITKKVAPLLVAGIVAMGAGHTAEASSNPYGNRLIKQVTRGNDVMEVQKDLKELKFYTTSGLDGIYGSASKQAVIKFQRSEGLRADGIVGPQTKRELANVMDSKETYHSQQRVQPSVKSSQHVKSNSTLGQRMVAHALRDRGIPYVWGGATHSGFDCSGFILHLFKEEGINSLPRNSADIYKHGIYVSKSNLQPGDIVFFKNTYRPGISHMGIYIGNNQFVHASSSKGTTITSLDNSYFGPRYAGAKRITS